MTAEYKWAWEMIDTIPQPIDTPLEALMMWGEPQFSQPDWNVIHIVAEALESLPPAQRLLIKLVHYERLSYSELTELLNFSSKSQAWYRVRDSMKMLEYKLLEYPTIRGMMKTTTPATWNEAADNELKYFDSNVRLITLSGNLNITEELRIKHRDLIDTVELATEDNPVNSMVLAHRLMSCGNLAAAQLDRFNLWDKDQMLDLLVSKQHDYGHENINAFGLIGVAVRMSDKLARLENLLKRNAEAANESLLDTYMDIVGYGVIAGMLSSKTFDLELEEINV